MPCHLAFTGQLCTELTVVVAGCRRFVLLVQYFQSWVWSGSSETAVKTGSSYSVAGYLADSPTSSPKTAVSNAPQLVLPAFVGFRVTSKLFTYVTACHIMRGERRCPEDLFEGPFVIPYMVFVKPQIQIMRCFKLHWISFQFCFSNFNFDTIFSIKFINSIICAAHRGKDWLL
jgi:hypothetical protein